MWVGHEKTELWWPMTGEELCWQSEAIKEFGCGLPSSVYWVLVLEQIDLVLRSLGLKSEL